jgi:ribosome-binding protein aMBF1 (putative translation factor)
VFGHVYLTKEEREAERRIREATRDRPSLEELKRRLGPGEPATDPEIEFFRAALAHKIGVAREKAGLTRAELARKIGTDEAAISRTERGDRNVTVETLARLARALGLKVTIEPVEQEK